MSLLLDALKKAAQQKAQKSKSEAASQRTSDETLLDVAPADEVSGVVGDDETELRARLERGDRISGDDTGLDFTDITDSARERDQRATVTGDETGLEVAEATETRPAQGQPREDDGDETGLEMPEQTRSRFESVQSERPASDDTGLEIPEESRARDSSVQILTGEDESIVFGAEDDVDTGADREIEARPSTAPEDETDLSQLDGPGHEAETSQVSESSEAMLEPESTAARAQPDDDQTDISAPVTRADQIEVSHPGEPDDATDDVETPAADGSDAADEDIIDEDLSLLLVDRDETGPGENTSFTNPQISEDRARALAEGDSADAELELVETTQSRIPADQTDTRSPTLTNPSATQLYGDDTRTDTLAAPTQSTVTRADSTSTRTYAPDNYDRTLMKLPSDDASKLFAGMKSDADVVMTPDYAKKVFRSKTSAQRVQYLKYYAGISVVLLLGIVFFGIVKYQEESDAIDLSLIPLKRDPMPGLIKPEPRQENDLFAGSDGQVDARTIKIIQNASDGGASAAVEPKEPASSGTVEAAATVEATAPQSVAEPETAAEQPEVAMATKQATTKPPPPAQSKSMQAIPPRDDAAPDTAASESTAPAAKNYSDNLQIKTSSQYRQADILLREAYAAYRSGDSQLAMERYNQVLKVDPGNRNALLARAAINIQNGNIDAAIRDYQTLLLANPKDSLAMSSLLGVGSYSPRETESQLKLMIRDDPDSPYLNFALANAYGAQHRWQEAQGYYFKALQNNPQDPNYAYNLAVSLEHISEPRSAITYYRRALDNFNNGLAIFSRDVVDQRLQVLGKL